MEYARIRAEACLSASALESALMQQVTDTFHVPLSTSEEVTSTELCLVCDGGGCGAG